MSARELIDAIAAGDSVAIQTAFETEMSGRIAERLDSMRQDVATNMFKVEEQVQSEEVDQVEEEMGKVHPDAVHVQPVGKGKYKVHAVGKNFADHVKAGEHLSDTELDDFSEMGG